MPYLSGLLTFGQQFGDRPPSTQEDSSIVYLEEVGT